MEKATLITDPFQIKDAAGTGRIYLGPEFCPQLLFSPEQLAASLKELGERQVSLMLPFIPQSYLDRAQALIDLFVKIRGGGEVTVQNWGLAELAAELGAKPTAGRFLMRQVKDPRLSGLVDGADATERMKQGALPKINRGQIERMKSLSIERIELDAPPWGLILPESLGAAGVKVSLHSPWAAITATRYCKLAQIDRKRQDLEIIDCNRQCRKSTYLLNNKSMGREMMLFGNVFLTRADEKTLADPPPGVDRIIERLWPKPPA